MINLIVNARMKKCAHFHNLHQAQSAKGERKILSTMQDFLSLSLSIVKAK
jgi:hypothetical protein